MKKTIYVVVAVLLLVLPLIALAGTVWERNSVSYWSGNIVSSTSSTGFTGSSISLQSPYRYYTCQATVSNAATTAVSTYSISGSIDGTNYRAIPEMAVVLTGSSTSMVSHSTGTTPFLYLRAALASHVSNTTALPVSTITCVASH